MSPKVIFSSIIHHINQYVQRGHHPNMMSNYVRFEELHPTFAF